MRNHQKEAALLAKEVCVPAKAPVQMFRERDGGGKTNISLLESSAEWASALKNINNTRRTQKIVGKGEEGERRRRSTSLPAEALCSGGVNCKRNICQRGCFELLGRKKVFFFSSVKCFFTYLCSGSRRMRRAVS